MKVNIVVFWIICAFFVIAAAGYTLWGILDTGEIEWVGGTALFLTGVLGGFVAFFLQKSYRSQGGPLPEDVSDANIDDGDPEMGFFSPWSWWPVALAGAAALFALGLAVGFWICFIGAALALVSLVGWVFEYYRGLFAR